jgi:hypothetical protein
MIPETGVFGGSVTIFKHFQHNESYMMKEVEENFNSSYKTSTFYD